MRSLLSFIARKTLRFVLTEYAREHRVKPLIYCARRRFSRPWPRTRTVYYLNPTLAVDTAVVMPIYNRPEYLSRTFASLLKTDLSRAVLILVDDDSGDTALLDGFHTPTNHIKMYKNKNIGMWHSYKLGFDLALANFSGIKYLVTLDSDTEHKKNWLATIIKLYEAHKSEQPIVTGFNSNSGLHPLVAEHADYVVKSAVGGINLLLAPDAYRQHFRRALHWHQNWWDHFVSAAQGRLGRPILVAKPSVIQHIGVDGRNSFSASGVVDVAVDF